tara:strand:+ start:891 stop:1463 length:573 start_codon:yes stop_codon:yes gene_type:complete
MMNIQDVFTNFLAIDTITINNIDTIEKFCYDKIRLEPSDPGQSDMSQLELDTLFVDISTQIEDRLEIIKSNFGFKDNIRFNVGRTWINLNQNNNVTKPHFHANSLLSGIFYIKCKNSGPIVFMHPVAAQQYVINSDIINEYNKFTSADISVEPEVGKLIIFPSWLVHYVQNNLDDSDRISIAFNIELTPS